MQVSTPPVIRYAYLVTFLLHVAPSGLIFKTIMCFADSFINLQLAGIASGVRQLYKNLPAYYPILPQLAVLDPQA
jgi:hypothetical protein